MGRQASCLTDKRQHHHVDKNTGCADFSYRDMSRSSPAVKSRLILACHRLASPTEVPALWLIHSFWADIFHPGLFRPAAELCQCGFAGAREYFVWRSELGPSLCFHLHISLITPGLLRGPIIVQPGLYLPRPAMAITSSLALFQILFSKVASLGSNKGM